MRPKSAAWTPNVMLVSALKKEGIGQVWESVTAHGKALDGSGERDANRRMQARAAMWSEIREGLFTSLKADPKASRLLTSLESKVEAGKIAPTAAARQLLELIYGPK